jgi:hypothetical protein
LCFFAVPDRFKNIIANVAQNIIVYPFIGAEFHIAIGLDDCTIEWGKASILNPGVLRIIIKKILPIEIWEKFDFGNFFQMKNFIAELYPVNIF